MNITLLDTFGDDLTVVNAARVSFAKESTEMGPRDEKLIAYLAEHNHVTPFFHPQVRFRIQMPIFIAREWYRHQIGFARNEVSRRYVDTPPEFWEPTILREKDTDKKQGSKDNLASLTLYNTLLLKGVCPEQARIILPQSMVTEFIETGSLAAYARLYKLRTDPHAQLEIREMAEGIGKLIENHFPVSWKALTS